VNHLGGGRAAPVEYSYSTPDRVKQQRRTLRLDSYADRGGDHPYGRLRTGLQRAGLLHWAPASDQAPKRTLGKRCLTRTCLAVTYRSGRERPERLCRRSYICMRYLHIRRICGDEPTGTDSGAVALTDHELGQAEVTRRLHSRLPVPRPASPSFRFPPDMIVSENAAGHSQCRAEVFHRAARWRFPQRCDIFSSIPRAGVDALE
jgi:hypothetical protein